MNLDIEKIKCGKCNGKGYTLGGTDRYRNEIAYKCSNCKGTGLIAAIEAYDPDAIRRENIMLAEKLRQYLPHCGKQDMTNGDRELVEWVEAIMNAGKGE